MLMGCNQTITEHLLAHSPGDTCDCGHCEPPTNGAGQSEDGLHKQTQREDCRVGDTHLGMFTVISEVLSSLIRTTN